MSEHDWGSESTGGYDLMTHVHASIAALHQSIEPAAIRSNILEVFIALHHALYGDAWAFDLGQEYQAWEQVEPAHQPAEWFLAARDAVGAAATELADGTAHWITLPDWHAHRDQAVARLVYFSAAARAA